jgi:type IV secretory pathway TrbD component
MARKASLSRATAGTSARNKRIETAGTEKPVMNQAPRSFAMKSVNRLVNIIVDHQLHDWAREIAKSGASLWFIISSKCWMTVA